MPLAAGATFAEYTILHLLSSGRAGGIYLARHPQLSRCDALRVLPRTMTADGAFREQFTRAAEAAEGLRHPHVVHVHGHGEFAGQLWVATEYVDGTTAARLVRDWFPAGLPAGKVLPIITALAAALDYIHDRGLLHGAVRPDNVLLATADDGEQRILLADVGVAQPTGPAAAPLPADAVGYAAPEQLARSGLDVRADQYGLAATAFYLLTAAPPIPHLDAVFGRQLNPQPSRLSDRHPELAPLDRVFATALAVDPAERFGSCSEFADALARRTGFPTGESGGRADTDLIDFPADTSATTRPGTARRAGAVPSAPAPAPVAPPRHRRSRVARWAIASAVALCAGLLAAAIVIGRGHDSTSGGLTTSPQAAAPTTAPVAGTPAPPAAGQELDGTYRVDVDRARQTYNETPAPQPPSVSTWWAFHTSCTPTGCVATGLMLDSADHEKPGETGNGPPLTLDFRGGAWQSRPEEIQFPCVGPGGAAGNQRTTQVIELRPAHSGLRGAMTITVQSNECGQQGAEIRIPADAQRLGPVPAQIEVPPPPTTTPVTPTAPPTPGR